MSNEMTAAGDLGDLSPQYIDTIRSQIARNCTDAELSYFLMVCKSLRLDPLSRQIYAIKRGGRMTIQVGIDGFRAQAHGTGAFAGVDDGVWSQVGDDLKCSVTVYRMVQGQKCGFTGSALMSEYNTGTGLWAKLSTSMLEKCAESKALRRGFSERLSGVYTHEEMSQAGDGPEVPDTAIDVEALPSFKDQVRATYIAKGWSRDGVLELLAEFKVDSIDELSAEQVPTFMHKLEQGPC